MPEKVRFDKLRLSNLTCDKLENTMADDITNDLDSLEPFPVEMWEPLPPPPQIRLVELRPEDVPALSAVLDIADDVLAEDGYDREAKAGNRELIARIQRQLKMMA